MTQNLFLSLKILYKYIVGGYMTITINNETYYTAKELSEKFNVTMETIRDWRKRKGLLCSCIGKRKYIFKESDIELFLKGR